MATRLISVDEAAERLGVIPQRVRTLIAEGRLPAERVGKQYVLEATVVDRFAREPRARGRPLSSANAWALLALLASLNARALSDRPVRSIGRIEALLEDGPEAVVAALLRSEPRAELHVWRVLPTDLDRLAGDSRLINTGLSADAKGINVRYQPRRDGIDAYVSRTSLSGLERELQPIVDSPNANVLLRTPQGADWILAESVAPPSVVAADLLNHDDPRVARAAQHLLERLIH